MTTPETSTPPKRRWRYALITLGAFALTVAIFYAEEDWRGKLAWDKARQQITAADVNLDWNKEIPAPVPDDQNFFGVPQMQEGFTGHGKKNWPTNWPATWTTNAGRMVVAHLTIGLPGATPPAGYSVVAWPDKGWSNITAVIRGAIGPVALNPGGGFYPKQSPSEIQPAQIFLQCQSPPEEKSMTNASPLFYNDWDRSEDVRVEPAGDGSYNLTVNKPMTAAEFLKSNEAIEPDLDLIRTAMKRPYAQMLGDYSEPAEIPIPNFVNLRSISQRLNAMAECHLLLGEPDKALDDLSLVNEMCGIILEKNKPMTLVSAMINVAVRGLDMGTINDGLQTNAWREPQLAALQRQLESINLLPPVNEAFRMERSLTCSRLSTKSALELVKYIQKWDKNFGSGWHEKALAALMPRGWMYQNAATVANLYVGTVKAINPGEKMIYPEKADAASKQMQVAFSHWSPYSFLTAMFIPNFVRANRTTALNQTMVQQTFIVCALQRYRLAHGEYPETLDALAPRYLDAIPHDVIGGQPPHYRRKADGTFLLYSIGWSGKDHGGAANNKDKDKDWAAEGDWIWPEK